jgi:hypothetical protein
VIFTYQYLLFKPWKHWKNEHITFSNCSFRSRLMVGSVCYDAALRWSMGYSSLQNTVTWSHHSYTYTSADIPRWSLHPHSNRRTKRRSSKRSGLAPEASCPPASPFSIWTIWNKRNANIMACLHNFLYPLHNQFDRVLAEPYTLRSATDEHVTFF